MVDENQLVSIIVPVYNVERYLPACLSSILEQTYKQIEVIIVNDGSTDGSLRICEQYAEQDDRISIINISNSGVSVARNCGIDASCGEYITFVDSDDTIEKSFIEDILRVLLQSGADYVNCATNYVYDHAKDEVLEKTQEAMVILDNKKTIEAICYLEEIFPGYEMAAVWGGIYTRKLIGDNRFNPRMKIGEDFVFKFETLKNAKKVVCTSLRKYNYLIRETSAMRNGYDKQKTISVVELEKYINYIEERYRKCFISRSVNIAIVILFMIPISKQYYQEREYIINFIKRHRLEVLCNKQTRKKVKAALLCSFLGFNNLQRIFGIIG